MTIEVRAAASGLPWQRALTVPDYVAAGPSPLATIALDCLRRI
jgi:hypothetical protein